MTEQQQPDETAIPNCPKCQGPMWDNRVGKKNPKAPDFKCKDRECDGVIWPPRGAAATATPAPTAGSEAAHPSARPGDAGLPDLRRGDVGRPHLQAQSQGARLQVQEQTEG